MNLTLLGRSINDRQTPIAVTNSQGNEKDARNWMLSSSEIMFVGQIVMSDHALKLMLHELNWSMGVSSPAAVT